MHQRIILLGIFLLAALMFLTGINWGLPARQSDVFLFGNHPVWTGRQIIDLAGGWDESADLGADVAMHPLAGRDKPIVLNTTDAQRAAIVRRYRLYSDQPDEMITFRSLSRMNPSHGDLDPRFYQYGGLWVYPVGALLKIASVLHLVTLRSDLTYYLDHSEQFGRFYIVARWYAAMWGLLGVGIVYAIGKEWTGQFFTGAVAATFYALMPVVVNMAHEAKPHLPGTVLTLCAILAALRYAKTGQTKWWVLAGISCGAAMGMVLTGIVSFIVLPVMTLYRRMSWLARARIALASAILGLLVFVITNPYLPYDFLFHDAALKSNLGNTSHFYTPSLSFPAISNAIRLVAAGMSLPLAAAAVAGILFLLMRRRGGRGWILAAVAILVAIPYVLLADGKPAEYGRFAMTLDVLLAIGAAAAIGSMGRAGGSRLAALVLIICTGAGGLRYVANFVAGATASSSRLKVAGILAGLNQSERVLAVSAEPAPYCLPPVNLFDWKIVLLPRGTQASAFDLGPRVVSAQAIDMPAATAPPDAVLAPMPNFPRWAAAPISWANKPFEILLWQQTAGR
jgi:hypothetical protein